jgi:hypothetical protein
MNGSATPTPNSHQLHTALGRPLPPESELAKLPRDPILSLAFPFTELITATVPIRCDHVSLGLHLDTCAARSRVYISDIDPGSTCSKIRDWRRKYKGAYVVQINGCPVFSESSALQQLARVVKSAPTASTPMLELIVAPDTPPSRLHPSADTPRLQLDQFRTVINTLYEVGEVIPMPAAEIPTSDQLEDLVYNITVSDGMVPGSKWTRRQLKRLNCWTE